MIVMMMAKTPSLNASSRPVVMPRILGPAGPAINRPNNPTCYLIAHFTDATAAGTVDPVADFGDERIAAKLIR